MLVRSLTLSALAAVLLALVPSSASAAKVARIVLKQSGATLTPGQSVVFEAVAVDKRGNPVPGASIRFKSNQPGTVRVSSDGTATAGSTEGEAILTASSGKKKATADVDVVRAPGGSASPDLTVAKASITHVVAHDGWVYWTENGQKRVRLRKIAKTGGLIYDLASEPGKDKTALTVSYLHLRIAGDRVFFSRQTRGFFQHFSILSVGLDGEGRQTHLKDDISLEPLFAGGWNIVGRNLLVSVWDPERLRLNKNTRIAVLDLDSGVWTEGVRGVFLLERIYITAVDNQFAYLRGTLANGQTQIARLDPEVGPTSLTEIFTFGDEDSDTPQPGVSDGVNLYFFSEGQGNNHRLLSLPLAGGAPVVLGTGPLGVGLTLREGFLYFALDGERLVRMPVGGGEQQTLFTGLEPTSTLGGIGVDGDSLYPVSRQGKVFTIHRIAH